MVASHDELENMNCLVIYVALPLHYWGKLSSAHIGLFNVQVSYGFEKKKKKRRQIRGCHYDMYTHFFFHCRLKGTTIQDWYFLKNELD